MMRSSSVRATGSNGIFLRAASTIRLCSSGVGFGIVVLSFSGSCKVGNSIIHVLKLLVEKFIQLDKRLTLRVRAELTLSRACLDHHTVRTFLDGYIKVDHKLFSFGNVIVVGFINLVFRRSVAAGT